MSQVLKKFGRYFLLDQIAQGGMAEIYRARLASSDGAGRILVIKRIQAGLGANSEFLKMFKSEIKVTMGFNHPNIVQLYDFGEEEQQPYIAMEFVDGKNLRQFIQRAAVIKQTLPVELSVFITEQAASGLHYAHSFKDKITGQPLQIVHRDISPQNIIISYEGNVKVIDFGIAKATTNTESTRAGIIKGKPSYLSPEQISGTTLDGRSDIFALGAVLWESLTGKKLFSGDSDLAVLKMIESSQRYIKPPSTLNKKVPFELDQIVMKSLEKNLSKRYQSAEELQRALHRFLYSFSPEFNPTDLAYYTKELFKDEIVEDRKNIQKLNEKVENLIQMNEPLDQSVQTLSAPKQEPLEATKITLQSSEPNTPSLGSNSPSKPLQRQSDTKLLKVSINSTSSYKRHPMNPTPSQNKKYESSFSPPPLITAITLILFISFFGPTFGVPIPSPLTLLKQAVFSIGSTSSAELILQGNQKNATVLINKKPMATSLPATLYPQDISQPLLIQVSSAIGTFEQVIELQPGEKKIIPVEFSHPSSEPSSINKNAADKTILLKLNLTPGGGHPMIVLNKTSINPESLSTYVPLDAPLELTIERENFKKFYREFYLSSEKIGGLKEWLMDIQLEPLKFGLLSLRTTPSAEALIPLGQGEPWRKKTPLENERLPIGHYDIRLTNEVLGMEKTIHLHIQEGKSVNLDVKLEID